MHLTILVGLLPLIAAAPACPTSSSSSAAPSESTIPLDGLRLRFDGSSKKCLVAKGRYEGATVGIATNCNDRNTLWDRELYSAGYLRLHDTNLCIDAGDYAARAPGKKITLQNCAATTDHRWYYPGQDWMDPWWRKRIELSGPSHAMAGPPHTGLCLDLTDGNLNNDLQIWTCYVGNSNQIFEWA